MPHNVTLPRYLLAGGSLPATWEDFETTADWVVLTGSRAANTSEFKTGTQSITITSPVGGIGSIRKDGTFDLSAMTRLSVWFYLHEAAATYSSAPKVFFYNATNGSAGFSTPSGWGAAMTPGWNLLNACRDDFTVIGAGDWAAPILRIRINAYAAAGQTVNVSVDDLRIGYPAGQPALLLRFDDGYDSTYDTAFAYMQPRNIRGVVACQTNQLDAAGRLTWAQARELDAAGWSIINHTNSGTDLTTLSEAQQEAQIAGGKADLVAQGLARCADHMVCPDAHWNADTRTAFANLGVLTGRNATAHTVRTPVLPPSDIWDCESTGINSTISVATVEGWVDAAIAGGFMLPLHFHDLDAAGQWTGAQFQAFIDYALSKGVQFPVITQADFYGLLSGAVTLEAAGSELIVDLGRVRFVNPIYEVEDGRAL